MNILCTDRLTGDDIVLKKYIKGSEDNNVLLYGSLNNYL